MPTIEMITAEPQMTIVQEPSYMPASTDGMIVQWLKIVPADEKAFDQMGREAAELPGDEMAPDAPGQAAQRRDDVAALRDVQMRIIDRRD